MAQQYSAPSIPATCPRPAPDDLPKPGQILTYDFRSDETKAYARSRSSSQPIKLLQWNVERGYKLPQIISELQALNADVLALQEIDIHCQRSDWQDTGLAIAKALGLHYAFLCEFQELWSPVRDPDAQGGGVHGNALLSKFDLSELTVVEHSYHPIDWEAPKHSLCQKEPRHGRRLTLAGSVATPQGPLLVYSAHLEVFCGMLARMRQFADIMAHVKAVDARGGPRHQAILGDLNTQANSLARLSPNYCTDHMRWLSLGWFEAEIWAKYVLGCAADPADPGKLNAWLARQGVEPATCGAITNPGFSDPWDPRRDITVDLIKYRWLGLRLMTGKLDWVLLRNCTVVSKAMGNDEYDKSDHKWLMCEVMLDA